MTHSPETRIRLPTPGCGVTKRPLPGEAAGVDGVRVVPIRTRPRLAPDDEGGATHGADGLESCSGEYEHDPSSAAGTDDRATAGRRRDWRSGGRRTRQRGSRP